MTIGGKAPGTVVQRVAVVIPALDEESAIGDVVRVLCAQGAVCCVIVVDGGSRDATVAVASRAGAHVVHEGRRGYGRACRTGTEVALQRDAGDGHEHDAVAFIDGDGACDPSDLEGLVRSSAHHDVVLGVRPARLLERDAMPWHARLGNVLVAGMAAFLTGRSVRDLPPLKLVRADAMRRIHPDHDGYGWTAQLVTRALADRGLRIAQDDASFRARRGGVSKVSGSWKTSIAAGRAMIVTVHDEYRARPVLALMAKAPRAGHAKTRLAADIGDEATAALWSACLADAAAGVRSTAAASRAAMVAIVPGADDVGPVSRIVGSSIDVQHQASSGLAGALIEVFLDAASRGADRAIAIAGDSPTIGSQAVLDALAELDSGPNAAVLGPTPDGGYYLVGLRWAQPSRFAGRLRRRRAMARLEHRLRMAFAGTALGTTSALDATSRGVTAMGWRLRLGPPMPDLDTADDLRALAGTIADWADKAPRTAAWIEGHRWVMSAAHDDDPIV